MQKTTFFLHFYSQGVQHECQSLYFSSAKHQKPAPFVKKWQPLIIRHPQEGDRMRPFGMKGSKLLSDLYTDAKLSRVERMQQWVLCHGDDIVWAVGMRASEHCRLAGDESEVLQISYIGSSANIIQDSKY